MARLRKMLGDIRSRECRELMNLMQTQSKATLAAWSVFYAKERYLPIYEATSYGEMDLRDVLQKCEDYQAGSLPLAQLKPLLTEARLAAGGMENPVTQAAARAIATACATVLTPTNALGFLFYGAAAIAYYDEGLSASDEVYDEVAGRELAKALVSLRRAAVLDEPNPSNLKWNC